jgi:transcriptional regulator with XRE-family HTH domain
MPRKAKVSKSRPEQGARLRELRLAAGLSQTELARRVGVPQPNIAFWERSEKPPRSDVLPAMAEALGVRVEDLLTSGASAEGLRMRKRGPVGKMQEVFELASRLPRRQQEKIVEWVTAFVAYHEGDAASR